MPDQARVSSIEPIETFRGDLIQYIAKARAAVDSASAEARRTKTWLATEQLNHWANEVKKRTKLLEQAEQELYSARLVSPDAANPLQKMNVQKATRHLAEAQDKLRVIQQWRKRIDSLADPLLRDLEPFSHLLFQVLPKGVVSLGETIKALQAYAETRPLPRNPTVPAE